MQMHSKHYSPLRYPGGKSKLGPFVGQLIYLNRLSGGTYIEPFAGGSGVALHLLMEEYVHRVVINDLDPAVYAFWQCATKRSQEFIRRIEKIPITIEEWERQKFVFQYGTHENDQLDLAVAFFFLNRTNRSGVLQGGAIGGKAQTGNYLIDARFNRSSLLDKLHAIHRYRSRIVVENADAVALLESINECDYSKAFVYLDPPYYKKGPGLYVNFYNDDDHVLLASRAKRLTIPWIMTYDNVPEITSLYTGLRSCHFSLDYSAHVHRSGQEVMFFSDNLYVPESILASRSSSIKQMTTTILERPRLLPTS